MNLKRIADDEDHVPSSSSVFSSPCKRARRDTAESLFPQTPASSSSKLPFATPKTPYTPYPLHASDSPSNPFGRKRKERLVHSLPPISSFSKHISLRFQFVRRGVSPRQGGVYRIVRVPKNYTFTHLRALIAWLFDTPARYANGKAGEEEYLFVVNHKTTFYSPLYKPGQIKTGTPTVKLSNVRDPGKWSSGNGFGSDEEDELSEEEGGMDELASQLDCEDNEDVDEEWKWSDEEDFTLGHAWHRGIDPQISILYQHSPGTQVHISVNTTVLPRQRGISNTPFVFSARGRVHLSPPPLPRPLFTKSILDTLSSSPAAPTRHFTETHLNTLKRPRSPSPPPTKSGFSRQQEDDLTDTDADGDLDQDQPFTSNHPFFASHSASPSKRRRRDEPVVLVEDSDAEDAVEVDTSEEDHAIIPDTSHWNEPKHAFAIYLLQFMDPLGYAYDDIDESFFEEDKAYDPFDVDSDEEVEEVVKRPIVRPGQMKPPPQRPQQPEEEQEEEEEDHGYEYNYEEGDGEEEEAEDIDLAASEKDDEEGEDDEAEADYDEYEDDSHQYTLGSTPGLTHCSSSSSPARFSPTLFPFASSSLPDLSIVLEEHYPNKKYSHTPAPPKARKHRLRITRLEKRLEKIKKMEFLTKYDEIEEPRVVEVDELEDEEEEEEDPPRIQRPANLEEGEEWDPFGDEEEV
ncbi:hypothetical protein BDN70DRAFT_918932 [Pholiota conissans]|uniref:Uncharacterized protein n=1 Tax=Pholiota conissans TaxID=109636 RepID=A0A9P5Z8S8_9AGAR|nr:hypothetical protein BDN70DRAFT_918932 [Pholiota conissans]